MATKTRSTLVAIFANEADARSAVEDLRTNGFTSSDVSLSCDAASVSGSISSHPHHEGGITGWFKSIFGADEDQDRSYYEQEVGRGSVCVSVDVTDENLDRAADILDTHSPVNVQRDTDRGADAASTSAYAETGTSLRDTKAGEGQSIPVVEEELRVGKRAVLRGGVRVYSRVVEQPVEESVRLREERVIVDRSPANRASTAADLRPGQEQVFEVKEYAEEPVVEKASRVVEDVRIRKESTEREQTVRDTVRHTEVNVENLKGESSLGTGRTSTDDYSGSTSSRPLDLSGAEYDASARTGTFGSAGAAGTTAGLGAGVSGNVTGSSDYSAADYDDDAYQYGYQLANDPRYRGRHFDEIESDLRTDYGRRYPGSTWERVKASVRNGWDKVTNKV